MSAPIGVLFVCVRNSGKSQLAAALARHRQNPNVEIFSAGTDPGNALNAEAVASLAELGIDVGEEKPKPITPEILRRVSLIVILGKDADPDLPDGIEVQRWITDEPAKRGIDGPERMRLIRDDIGRRVERLMSNPIDHYIVAGQADTSFSLE